MAGGAFTSWGRGGRHLPPRSAFVRYGGHVDAMLATSRGGPEVVDAAAEGDVLDLPGVG
jgi:hypothetical protein